MTWNGDEYQGRFDALAAQGMDVHGEAAFVGALGPSCVLDAGCGTGRVARELHRRGIEVVGVDMDPSMLATARDLAPTGPRGDQAGRGAGPPLSWVEADLATLDLGRTFDVVVMAGNVPLYCPAGTQAALVAGCARHVRPGGALVAGFGLDRDYDLETYDHHCAAAGVELAERWSTWDREGWEPGAGYAVSVHRRRR
ncbi:MAG: class I SAM-dependent methyltransferase [Acidimicrobiales bacterium]